MAVAAEEHGREIVEVYLQAMRKGDWRAAEALMSRIYGKPEETVTRVNANPATAVLKSMSLEEKLELLQRLQAESRSPSLWSSRLRRPRSPAHPRERD
jgi:hypothetical protein